MGIVLFIIEASKEVFELVLLTEPLRRLLP